MQDQSVLLDSAWSRWASTSVTNIHQAGYTVVVTASPRDFDRQKELGAAEVVDYKAPDAVDQLRKLGPYRYLFTASGDPTSQQALAALLPEGGRFASVLPGSVDIPANVEIVYTAFSQAAQKDDYKSWRDWWYGSYLPDVLTKRAVATVKYVKVEGGLTSLQQASQDVFDGKVRGKLVINPQE